MWFLLSCVLGCVQAMALRLPTITEVVDRIDEADPVLVWKVGAGLLHTSRPQGRSPNNG